MVVLGVGLGLGGGALAGLSACGNEGSVAAGGPGIRSIFVVPAALDELAGETFFDHPFPSDMRRDADGSVRFTGFPNPVALPLVESYIQATRGLTQGFSPASTTYLRFDGAIDPRTLPGDPSATLDRAASVQIVDVDAGSPERGSRHLAQTFWKEEAGVYWPAHTLAVRPMLGRPLRPRTTYAVVVTRGVRAAGGGEVRPAPALEALLGGASGSASLTKLEAAIAGLGEAGIAASEIVHVTSFTTEDPTAETFAAMSAVPAVVEAPTARDWRAVDALPEVDVYEGTYGPSPDFQVGTPPFRRPADGGGFVLEGGAPKLQRVFDLRFALAIPNAQACPPPSGGYPVVLYAHGTGGDYRSFVSDGTARALGRECLATMGIDQIFHGTRPGAPRLDDPQAETTIQLLFFNLDNVLAARTNNRQAAIDVVQQGRLFADRATEVPATTSRTGAPIPLDGTRLTFFGHSQGGLNGPLYLAGSSQSRGGVLSGAASDLGLALLEKTKPVDVAAAFRVLVGLGDREAAQEMNLLHPIMMLVQSLVDPADPLEYGSAIVREPRGGGAPKSIFQTEGVAADGTGDSYAPPRGIETLAVAIGLPRLLPGVRSIPEAAWAGIPDLPVPAGGVAGNLGGGRASGALAQFVPPAGVDGHFVVFRVPAARAASASFLRALAADPVGRIPAN